MSKFNNPSRALAPTRPPLPPPPSMRPPIAPPPPAAPDHGPASMEEAPAGEAPLVRIGFVFFCLLLISAMLNDWAALMFGGHAYISFIMVILTPVVWLACGNTLRGFRDKVGMAWVLLFGFMLLSIPFSVWRSNSLSQAGNYISRSLCFYFYAAAFVTSFKRCRTLMLVNIIVAGMVLISCFKFGYADLSGDARFQIRGSMFVGNSNDLALQLTIGMTQFVFLFYLNGIWKRVLGSVGILLSLYYMLKTGSRGCAVAFIIALVVTFIFTKQKAKMAITLVPLLIVAFFFTPASSVRRLLSLFQPSNAPVYADTDISALESKAQREDLLRKSVTLTLQHPVFGVGMGEFVIATMGEAAKKGEWAAALGTHNSYTQISSECGIPALICYVTVLWISFRRSYQIYQLAARRPQFREVEGLAFSLFIGTMVWAIATFFFHVAYSGLLPLLSGQVMALHALAYPLLTSAREPLRRQMRPRAGSRLAVQPAR